MGVIELIQSPSPELFIAQFANYTPRPVLTNLLVLLDLVSLDTDIRDESLDLP